MTRRHIAGMALALAAAALGACTRERPPAPPPARVRPLATFTVDLAAARPVPKTVARAAFVQVPVVRDGQPTNPEGTFELWSEFPFSSWPADVGTCHGASADWIEADVFLKAFTVEQLRDVAVVFTRIDGTHPTCVSDTPPAGLGDPPLGVRIYAAAPGMMQGSPAAPTAGGIERAVTWSFDWTTPDVTFVVGGEIWAEPVPALSEFGDPFPIADPSIAASIGGGETIRWSQVPGRPGDPPVDAAVLRICADPGCATVAHDSGPVARGGDGEFTYTLPAGSLTAGRTYWAVLLNRWIPGVPLSTVTGSLSPTPARLVYTGP